MTDLRAEEIREALELTLDVYASLTTPIMSDAEATVRAAARAYLASLEQEPDYEPMCRWLFLTYQGIDPDEPYNDGRPYGDVEWRIDRELAMRHHMADARRIVDAALAGFRSQPKGDNK